MFAQIYLSQYVFITKSGGNYKHYPTLEDLDAHPCIWVKTKSVVFQRVYLSPVIQSIINITKS